MSDKSNYPDGSFNDPSAPWNQEDITESDAFADKREEMTDMYIKDLNGSLIESFTEASTDTLIGLSVLLRMPKTDDTYKSIGKYVRRMVIYYCTPPDDEIIEAMEAGHDI